MQDSPRPVNKNVEIIYKSFNINKLICGIIIPSI
jgi:hypothetical protein